MDKNLQEVIERTAKLYNMDIEDLKNHIVKQPYPSVKISLKLIEKLEREANSDWNKNSPDSASWHKQTGVLLTPNEAKEILSFIRECANVPYELSPVRNGVEL